MPAYIHWDISGLYDLDILAQDYTKKNDATIINQGIYLAMGVATSKPGSRDRAIENAMRLLQAGEVSQCDDALKTIDWAHEKLHNKIKIEAWQKVMSLGESCGNAKAMERQESPRVGSGHWQVRSSLLLDSGVYA